VSSALLAQPGSLLHHHPLGVSTGYMAARGDWPRLVEEARAAGPFAAELAALSGDELPSLTGFLRSHPELPFRYLSVHAPTKRRQLSDTELISALEGLPAAIDAIVIHPDVMDEAESFARLGPRLLIENMDRRKVTGRTADELLPVFEALPEAGLCFDVAHSWSVDPSMDEAHALLDAFAARLRHVHLSSLDDELHHVPLRDEDQELFAPLLQRCRDVPWILEAPAAGS
jgi:hypothetical protein